MPRTVGRTRLLRLVGALIPAPFVLYALALQDAGLTGEAPTVARSHALVSIDREGLFDGASGGAGASCSLPLGRQVAAVRAFDEMMPVFSHPRCFNCHGGFDIASDEHEGSDAAASSGLDWRGFLTAEERVRLHSQCGSCHDNVRGTMTRLDGTQLGGWLIAPPPMRWDVSRPDELCMQLKQFEPDGDAFIDHIDRDHGEIQFVEAAFNGDRALGPEGLASFGLTAEPPPGTKGQLVEQARRWVGAMDAERGWPGEPSCGCVMPELELKVHIDIAINADATATGRMTATVPLEADSTGLVYHGEAPLTPSDYTFSPVPPRCSSRYTYTDGTFIVRQVHLDVTDDGELSLDVYVNARTPGGELLITCPNIPRPLSVPNMVTSDQWVAVNSLDRTGPDYHFTDFETPDNAPAEDGRTLVARKEVTRAVEADGGTVSATTVLELWAIPRSGE